jgi:aminoglycoside phosphotransferase (APT) family kinase protein
LPEELDRWTKLLRHAEDPDWHAAGTRLGMLLAARMPDDAPVGLVHGDFQPGNILYEDGRAGGLIDWELASIGTQGLDLGWMLMMIDALAWHPDWRPVASISAGDLIESYRRSGGPAFLNLDWYQGSPIIVSVRSPASMSNCIERASVRTPCGNVSRRRFRFCSRAASRWPKARPPITQKEAVE